MLDKCLEREGLEEKLRFLSSVRLMVHRVCLLDEQSYDLEETSGSGAGCIGRY